MCGPGAPPGAGVVSPDGASGARVVGFGPVVVSAPVKEPAAVEARSRRVVPVCGAAVVGLGAAVVRRRGKQEG